MALPVHGFTMLLWNTQIHKHLDIDLSGLLVPVCYMKLVYRVESQLTNLYSWKKKKKTPKKFCHQKSFWNYIKYKANCFILLTISFFFLRPAFRKSFRVKNFSVCYFINARKVFLRKDCLVITQILKDKL